jgi:hypothetical protein
MNTMTENDCALFAAAAAGYWADLLRGGRSPSLTRDAGHPDDARSTMGDLMLAMMPRPASDNVDIFEQRLMTLVEAQLRRCGEAWLDVDYSPEGRLAEPARTAGVSGFPFKTHMRVDHEEMSVREGYGADDRVLCTTKRRAIQRAASKLHWADSPWTEERRDTRTEAEIDAWEARGDRIGALIKAMPDTPAGDFDALVAATFKSAKRGDDAAMAAE